MRLFPSSRSYIFLQLTVGYAAILLFLALALTYRPRAIREPTPIEAAFFAIPMLLSYLACILASSKFRGWLFRSRHWPIKAFSVTVLSIGISSGIAFCSYGHASIIRDPALVISFLMIIGPATIGAAPAGLLSVMLFAFQRRRQARLQQIILTKEQP